MTVRLSVGEVKNIVPKLIVSMRSDRGSLHCTVIDDV